MDERDWRAEQFEQHRWRNRRRPAPARRGSVSHRNGYEPRKVRMTSGTVELERPRVRDASRLGFESRGLG
jgi:hypothetical protein